MEDKIIELLGAGVPASVVATTVGCDPSYVSQLMAREDISGRVAELRLAKAAEHVEHDNNIADLEKVALEKMAKLLPMQTDVMKVTKVFQVLNAAKKSSDVGLAQQASTPATIVSIELPEQAMVALKLTVDKQVVEVGGRSMVPMPSHMVAAKLREKKAHDLLEHAKERPMQALISQKTLSLVDQL